MPALLCSEDAVTKEFFTVEKREKEFNAEAHSAIALASFFLCGEKYRANF